MRLAFSILGTEVFAVELGATDDDEYVEPDGSDEDT